jgi:hypothetical protein
MKQPPHPERDTFDLAPRSRILSYAPDGTEDSPALAVLGVVGLIRIRLKDPDVWFLRVWGHFRTREYRWHTGVRTDQSLELTVFSQAIIDELG